MSFWGGFEKQAAKTPFYLSKSKLVPLGAAAGFGGLSLGLSHLPSVKKERQAHLERRAKEKDLKPGSKEYEGFVKNRSRAIVGGGALASGALAGYLAHRLPKDIASDAAKIKKEFDKKRSLFHASVSKGVGNA